MFRLRIGVWPRYPTLATALLILGLTGLSACRPAIYATISSPKNGEVFTVGEDILFHAEVNSDHPVAIQHEGDWLWTSDLDGNLGGTPLVYRNDLSVGEHLITLRVRNSADVVLREQVKIFVVR
jgi:hypothetical protein